jgi:hypothetical protein
MRKRPNSARSSDPAGGPPQCRVGVHRNHIFELLRRLAEAAEQRRKPQPTQTVYAPGSMGMGKGVATADAVAESSAERWRFSGGRDSEIGSSGGTHVAPSERWRSGWDHEFESPLLQQPVCLSGEPRG